MGNVVTGMEDATVSLGVAIDGVSGSVRISHIRRTYPEAEDRWDGNWLSALVAVNVGGFTGKSDIKLRSDEIEEFLRNIQLLVQGQSKVAVYDPMEPWLKLAFRLKKVGHYEVKGEITDRLGTGNVLKFSFEATRQHLQRSIDGIRQIAHGYPTRKDVRTE